MSETTGLLTDLIPPADVWRFHLPQAKERIFRAQRNMDKVRPKLQVNPWDPEQVTRKVESLGGNVLRDHDGKPNLRHDEGLQHLIAQGGRVGEWTSILRNRWNPEARIYSALKPFIAAAAEERSDIIRPEYDFTVTGRLIIRRFPLHGLPKTQRDLVSPAHGGSVVTADWSSLELRLAAAISGDTALLEWFAADRDPLQMLAEQLNQPRDTVKAVLYGIMYGAGSGLTAAQLGCSIGEAQKLKDRVFKRLHGLHNWRCAVIKRAKRDTYVTSAGGQQVSVVDKDGCLKAYRAPNYILQSSGADLLVQAVNTITAERGLPPELTWHDAIYLATTDTAGALDLLRDAMTKTPPWMSEVPLKVTTAVGKDLRCDRST